MSLGPWGKAEWPQRLYIRGASGCGYLAKLSPPGNEIRKVKPDDRESGWEVSLATLRAVLILNTQEEGGTDRRQHVGAGGRLPGQASAMQARARQSAPSFPITASGPCSPRPSPPPSWSQEFLAVHPIVSVFHAGQGTAQREKGSLL